MKIKINATIMSILLFIVPIIIGLYIASDLSRPNVFANLPYLPIFTGLIFIVLFFLFRKEFTSFPLLCTISLFYIRNIIAPLALTGADYKSYFSSINNQCVNNAILLMLFETFALSLFSVRMVKVYPSKDSFVPLNNKSNDKVNYFVIIMTFISVAMLALNPNFLGDYVNILSAEEIRETQIGENASGPLYTLFTVIFPLTYLSVSLFIMSKVIGKSDGKIIVLACICIPFMFMNNSDAFTLITVFCLGLTALKFRGMSQRTFSIVMGIGLLFVTIYILSVIANSSFNADNTSLGEKVSNMLQGYFPGVTNISGIFNMREHDKLLSLFFDLYATIPFRSAIFGIQQDFRLVIMYTYDNGAFSQVLPCSAQFYYYLNLFGVFFECIFIKYAHLNYYKALREDNIYIYYSRILLFTYLIMTPVVYNATLFLTRYFVTLLPMLIVFRIVVGKRDKLAYRGLSHYAVKRL